jgi:dihydropteroate synthase
MWQDLISQVINFSSPNIFNKFKQKYSLNSAAFYPGLIGIELRNIPGEISINNFKIDAPVFIKDNDILMLNFQNAELLNKNSIDRTLIEHAKSAINNFIKYDTNVYKIGNKQFSFDNSYTMGIINVTPDSFSDGGVNFNPKDAINSALKMIDSGADIIDIGGESSKPGSLPVSIEEEISRVAPVVKEIKKMRPEIIISVDTTKSEVAENVLELGAEIINDISGLMFDKKMPDVVKKFDAGIIIMHMKGTPKNMQENPEYDDVVTEVYDFLFRQVKFAKDAGINKIFIDPGIGFGKKVEHNLELLNQLENFKSIGCPIVVGISRKSLFKKLLGLETGERENATSVFNAVAIQKGARIIRTHNVEFGIQTCKLLNSLNKPFNV